MVAEEKIQKNSDVINVIEIPELIARMRRDGIVHVTFRKGMIHNLEMQAKLLDLKIKITEGKRSYIIYDAEDDVTITKEARDNATKIEHLAPIKAAAVVTNNLAYRLIANFYVKFNRPKKPFKVFDTLEKGIAWLKTLPDQLN